MDDLLKPNKGILSAKTYGRRETGGLLILI